MILVCAAAILVTLAFCSTSHANADGRELAVRIDPYQNEDADLAPQNNLSFPQLTTFAWVATLVSLPDGLDANRVSLVKQGLESSLLENLKNTGDAGEAVEDYVGALKSLEGFDKSGWLQSIIELHCSDQESATSTRTLKTDPKQANLIKSIMIALKIRLYSDHPQSVLLPLDPPRNLASGEILLVRSDTDALIVGPFKPGSGALVQADIFVNTGDLESLKSHLESLNISHVPMVSNHLLKKLVTDTCITVLTKYIIEILQPPQSAIIKTCLACETDQTLRLLLPMIQDDQAFSSLAFTKLLKAATTFNIHRAFMIKGIRSEGEAVPRLCLNQEKKDTLVFLARLKDCHPQDSVCQARQQDFINSIESW